MKPIRSLVAISVIAVGAYVSYDNIDRVMSWLRPAPVTSVRVEVPVPVVAIKEAEVEVKAEPKVEPEAPKVVVAPKPPAPAPAPAPVVVPAKVAQAAAELPPEPVKKAVATAAAVTAAVAVEPKPAPKTVPAVPPVVAAVPAKEPVKEPVLKPAVEALAAPAKETGKPVSQVAAVVAVSDALPLTPLPAATVPAAAQPKDSAQKTKPAAEKVKDIQLTIKDIKFTGVTVFSVKELSKVVSEYVGKELTVQEAFAIPAKVTQHYKNQNHMAIATLVGAITPDGVLTVGVVEMQMSQTQAEKELATLAPPTAAPVPASTSSPAPLPVMVPASPSASSTPLPSKNDAASETDYILKNYAKKSRQFEIVADNFGHESTGGNRMGASFAFDEDRFMVTGFKSQGSDYLRMAVRWATGIEGLKLGASLSRLNYEVVSHLETAIYRSGDAAKKSVELIYQLVNEPGHISSLGLHYASKSIHSIGLNLADSTSMTSSVPSLEWKGMLREMMPGGAVFTYGASYAHGQVDTTGASTMGGLNVPEGMFSKLRFDGTLMQPLGGLGSVYGRVSLQTTDKNLDPSERLYLGGPLGVRAYGIGDGVGSQGGLFSIEMRQRIAAGTTLSEFYDLGSVRQVNDSHPSTVLKGYGLSLSQELGDGVTLRGTWARSMGKQPDPALPQNGDGQYDRNRFWLSMESRF